MLKKLSWLLVLMLSGLLVMGFMAGCASDDDDDDDGGPVQPTEVSAIMGSVKDVTTLGAISGVVVSVGDNADTTDANGEYILTDVPAGGAIVVADVASYATSVDTVTVTENDTTDHNFLLAEAGTLSGEVYDYVFGDVIAGATLTIYDGYSMQTATADANGIYTFDKVAGAAGGAAHSLTATATDFFSYTTDVTVYPDSTVDDADMGLFPDFNLYDKDMMFRTSRFGEFTMYSDLETEAKVLDRVTPILGFSSTEILVSEGASDDMEGDGGYPYWAASPEWANAEMVTEYTFDTQYASPQTAVDAEIRGFMWQTGDYFIFRFSHTNNTGAEITPYLALEIIPQLEDSYGNESADYDATNDFFYVYKGGEYVGFKFLNQSATSMVSETYQNLENAFTAETQDSYRWNHLTATTNSSFPVTESYGLVNYLNAGQLAIASGATSEVYVAVAFGADLTTLQSAMSAAETQYQSNQP